MASWEICLGGEWKPADATLAAFLKDLQQRGQAAGKCRWRGQEYSFNLQAMTQTNLATGKERRIRCVSMEELGNAVPASPTPSAAREQARCVEVWLAGEWKKLRPEESREILRSHDMGEKVFQITSRSFNYQVDLKQMTQTNVATGRTRTIRIADTAHHTDASLGFDQFRAAFREICQEPYLTEALLLRSWAGGKEPTPLVQETVQLALREMDVSRNSKIDMVEWNHYWALERDNTPFHSSLEVNEKLAAALKIDPQVLGRMQMHFETAVGESGVSQRLPSEGLVRVCQRLVSSPKDVLEKKWAADLLAKHRAGEGPEEDADLSYYDFLNVMLGRKRFKVWLWMYDISDGFAKRWSWLLLGQNFDGIWHTGTIVEWPECTSEFWFGGAIFESKPGTTPFGTPVEKRFLGYTYKRREEAWDHVKRQLAPEFTKANYDVLTHNCNHFSEKLSLFLRNDHIPDEVLKQPDMVMSTFTARALRPLLNRWLGGFESTDGRATDGGEAARLLWAAVRPGALVEYCKEDGGKPQVGHVLEVSQRECLVQSLDFWQHVPVELTVPRALVTRLLREPPAGVKREVSCSSLASAPTHGVCRLLY